MKKQAIKSAVERAKERFLPQAIKDEARYQAHDEVRQAVYPSLTLKEGPVPAAEETQAKPGPASPPTRSRVFSPSDPKICGGQ